MNYTLQQLKDRVNTLIEQQGETAYCAAWIYTKEDCHLKDENGQFDYDNVCLLYTSPSPRDLSTSRMPSSA